MSIIKKWSTGSLGNEYPDHSDRGNPNTRGLTGNNIPGIEGYIEEDEVVAYEDNRPLKNLAENDLILNNNLTDVTSEVDYGVIRNRYNEFNLDILEYEIIDDPNKGSVDQIEITPLRIKSGSMFVNGSVIRTGNQKIIYFIKIVDGNETEFLFPEYNELENKSMTTIDDPEFEGEYRPVYSTIAEDIPENFDRFEIEIINTYSDPEKSTRRTYFNTYRNWEDVVPYPPEEDYQDEIDLIFEYDDNYGQNSKGVWLQPEGSDLINIKVSDVEVKKDIKVNDKYLDSNNFKLNSDNGYWESIIITDGIFFDNVRWESNVDRDIQSIFADEEENIFFIYDFSNYNPNDSSQDISESDIALYKITAGTDQMLRMNVPIDNGKLPTKLVNVGDYLFVVGKNGLVNFLDIWNEEVLSSFNNFTTSEEVKDVNLWDDKLWIATETQLYYTDYENFLSNPDETNFEYFDFLNTPDGENPTGSVKEKLRENYFENISSEDFTMFDHIQDIYPIKGNYVIDSSLINDVDNLIKNPSFEDGGIGNAPIHWDHGTTTEEIGTVDNFSIVSGDSVFGNRRAVISPVAGDTNSWITQTIKHDLVPGNDWTFSIYLKASQQTDFDLTIYELDKDENVLDSTTTNHSIDSLDIWERYHTTHTVQNEASYIKVEVNKTNTSKLQFDGAQLELGTEPSQFVYGYDYLLIAFRKFNDVTNPPFILIDARHKYDLQYIRNTYGDVQSVNDILDIGHNEIYFVDNKNIYKMQFLNSIDTYDRINITNITDHLFDKDFRSRIDTLNTIEEIDNRIYFGSSILNKNISFEIKDSVGYQEHTVRLLPPDDIPNFLDIIGDWSFVQATENSHARIEFELTEPLLENDSNLNKEYRFIPASNYGFKIEVDGDTKEHHTEQIEIKNAPYKNEGPWYLEDIYEEINRYQGENNLFTGLPYTIDWGFETSTKKIDGFYSIGQNKVTHYLRGNVKEISKPKNIENKPREEHRIYITRDKTILKVKYDPNIKKENNVYPKEPGNVTGFVDSVDQLPTDVANETVYYVNGWGYFKWSSSLNKWRNTNYFHKWDLYNDDYELREFRKKANEAITFNDTTHDQLYVDLPLDSEFDLLEGSLRVKVNTDTEYGFSEGIDYFVDYENNRIIRNNSENVLKDPKFKQLSSSSSKWNLWANRGDIKAISDSNEFESFAKIYLEGSDIDRGVISQVFTPSTISLGQTYTFSIYVKSNIVSVPKIILSETSSTAPTTVVGTVDISDGIDWQSNPQYFSISTHGNAPEVVSLNTVTYDVDTIVAAINNAFDSSGINDVRAFSSGNNVGFTTTGNLESFTLETADLELENALSEIGISPGAYTGEARHTTFKGFDYENRSTIKEAPIYIGEGERSSGWIRYEVSHSIQYENTDALRVEFETNSDYKILIKDAQLERNSYATPFILEKSYSRIDPGATVYCDFIQYKVLDPEMDYEFNKWDDNLEDYNRRVSLKFTPHELSEFYFDYKYERIFNPHRFGNSLPRFDVKYDPKDDYFLYENSGRIWAINQILALLSLDEKNRLKVSYKYYYPRIDKIKIRNHPDKYGNFLYYVKGVPHKDNPYSPVEPGTSISTHVEGNLIENYPETQLSEFNIDDNDTLYAINVTSYDFDKNDIYDRRIFVESNTSPYYNISLQDETLAYFPFEKDFISTNGLHPINEIEYSRITSIVKNYSISQNEEVGAWSSNYEIDLRYKEGYPEKIGGSISTFVNADTGRDDGGDEGNYDGSSRLFPFRTISRAIKEIKEKGANPNIVVTSTSTIYEDVEVDVDIVDHILIKADTYFKWRGNFYNKTDVWFQGIIFENFNHYVASNTSFYHCEFVDTTVNNFYPLEINFYNCNVHDVHNTFLNINTQLFPSPFVHPYMKSASRDDGEEGSPESVATSDWESIYPNENGFNFELEGSPRGYYTFYRCLMNRVKEDLVNYNIGTDKDWKSDFTFEKCTIVNGSNLFRTENIGQNILYNECIIWNNRFYTTREGETSKKPYWFDSESSIEFLNTFVDFNPDIDEMPAREINLNPVGELFGRETCSFSGDGTIDPGFIETENKETEDYHLKSIAKGFLFDSPAIGMAADGRDIGCYDEIRERVDLDIPIKFKSNFALIQESILYPIVINSEKVTFTLEFKPTDTFNKPGILFDTRSEESDEDYVIVAYNSNKGDKAIDLKQDPDADPKDPYTFKVIVANKLRKFVAVSPIKMDSDSEFQVWNRISFTVNYEKTFNQKASFDERDRYQNIITFYHNDQLAVETFIKNDLNRDEKGEFILNKFSLLHPDELEEFGTDEMTNAWNFNNISSFVSLAGPFDNSKYNDDYNYVMSGYYSELRIDNKFTNRKELKAWNNKKLPFNDPNTYIDQSTFVKTIGSSILNEFWSLKDKYGIGAKGNKFGPFSRKRFTYERGELVWSLSQPTVNLIENSDFSEGALVHITADEPMDLPANLNKRMFITTPNSRVTTDYNGHEIEIPDGEGGSEIQQVGVEIRFYETEEQASTGIDFNTPQDVLKHINNELFRISEEGRVNGDTKIRARFTEDMRLELYSLDWNASSIGIYWENPGDPYEMGFSRDKLNDWNYLGEASESNINVLFVDSMRTDDYTADGSPSKPFKLFSVARTYLEEGTTIKIVNGQTTDSSTYSDFGIDLSGGVSTFSGKSISEAKKSSLEVQGIIEDSLDRHEVWSEFDPAYSRLSGNSLGIYKKFLENEPLKVYFNKIKKENGDPIELTPGASYTLSIYIYSKDDIDNTKIRFIKRENGVEVDEPFPNFDEIERIFGNWFKVTKNIDEFSDAFADVGIATIGDCEFYIDTVQLEKSVFSTPYIKGRSDSDGVLEVNKSLVSEDSGIIFFRFKPILNFDTEDEVVLLNTVRYSLDENNQLVYEEGSSTPKIDWDKGFKVSYKYNSTLERGILEFKTNNLNIDDNSTHRFYIPQVLWDKWHSVVIYYNYSTNRFIYFFDHFKQDIESIASVAPLGSNLFIGRDVPRTENDDGTLEWKNSGDDRNKPSANILVKDIILTNYTISEKEINNWISAEEFYKESSFSHLLDEYQAEILQRIRDIELVSQDTQQIVNKIDEFEETVINFEYNIENTVNNEIPDMQTTLESHSSQLIDHRSDLNNVQSNVQDLYDVTNGHTGRLDSVEDLSNSNNTLIVNEINNREDADTSIRNDLKSTSLGEGAYLIGVHDETNKFSSTTVEGILHEIAGEDRDADHTIKGNYDIIQNNINLYDSLEEDVRFIKDGNTDSWTQTKAANNGWNIADLRNDINSNDTDITNLQDNLSQEISDRENADTVIRDDFASTTTDKGASLVGVEDANSVFTHETVESVLNEIAGLGRTNQSLKSNYDAITSNDTDISNIQSDITSINTELLEIGKVKDGDDGSTWDIDLNLVSLDSRINTNVTDISTNTSNISTNADDISSNSSFISTVQTNLNDEITNRESADASIRNDLASTGGGKGASLIGIRDVEGHYSSSTVEGALGEIDNKLQTLQNSMSWQQPVDTKDDLPTEGNTDGDARTVLDDGDGFAAQYVWNGTEWVKIADINWGSATDLSFDNSTSQIDSTNVQDAILEVYERAQDPTKAEDNVEANSFSTSDDRFFYDINHDLGTEDVTILPISSVDGRVVGVDEVEMVDLNTTRVWVTDDSEGLNFTVFGGMNNYAKVVGNWTSSDGMYYHNVDHRLNSSKLMYSIFDIETGRRINIDEVIFTNDNTVTLWASSNTFDLNIFLLKKASSTKIKDVDNWEVENGMYIARMKMPEDYDAIYSFIDSSGKATEIDELWFENGYLKISSTSNEKLRLVILK